MLKFLNLNYYSFNAKALLSLLILAFFLISVLLVLIIPKIQEDQYNTKIKEIEQVLSITEEQIRLAGKAIVMQSVLEIKANKFFLELQLANIRNNLIKPIKIDDIKKLVEKSSISKYTHYAIKNKNDIFISEKNSIYKKYKIKNYNKWEELISKKISKKDYVYNIKYLFYTTKLFDDFEVTIFCESGELNKKHFQFEEELKKNIQNTFNLTQDLHKGKTYIFWLNSKYKNEDNIPLYIKNLKKSEVKYTLSKMSNVSNIYTGNLTAKQIINARNKDFVEHTLNGKKAISWIRDLYKEEYDGYTLLLVKTIYKEDLIKQIDSALLKALPAAIISLFLAIVLGFLIFKRLFKGINILTNTAKEVNKGNRKIRSCINGKDDIGDLGIAFDLMLDSFENNIKTLDLKVEEKTKKLQNSLEEKEILLKEIHHRVKNNLALTISLIKLQEEKIEEEKAKEILIETQERIYAMELLHRALYQSANFNKIDFKEYVNNLVNNLLTTYKYTDIETNIYIKDIYLNIQIAMPCGLILNELITNAFKYAFYKNKNPKLEISIEKNYKRYFLIIKDNGKGIDKNIDINNSNTLGLKLINSITKLQLKGNINYIYNKGACFKIDFEDNPKKRY